MSVKELLENNVVGGGRSEDGVKIIKVKRKAFLEALAECDADGWIPVNLGPPYDNRPKKSGKILVLTKNEKKIFEVSVTVGEDEFEEKDCTPVMCPTHRCYLPGYGSVLLGEDDCITHWKPRVLPKEVK